MSLIEDLRRDTASDVAGFVETNLLKYLQLYWSKQMEQVKGLRKMAAQQPIRRNTEVVAIGDVHGCATLLRQAIWPHLGSKAVHILRPQLHGREEPGVGGEVTVYSWASYRPVAVFNASDLEGEPLPALIEARKEGEGVEAKPEPKRLEKAEVVLGAWPVPVSFGGDRACYLPAIDRIQLPDRASFHSLAAFCATWAHEQIHPTGHELLL